MFTDGDFTAVLKNQDPLQTQDETDSSAENSDTDKPEITLKNLTNNTLSGNQDNADRRSGSANQMSGETVPSGDTDSRVNEHIETRGSPEEGTSTPGVSNQYKLVHEEADGRCLFRSLVVGMNQSLQMVERNDNGKSFDTMLEVYERGQSDEIRAKMVSYMCTHVNDYADMAGDAVNADMPPHIRFLLVQERIAAIADPKCMPGEFEINVTSAILRRPICVMSQDKSVISIYGVNSLSSAEVLFVQFENVGQDVGHYDCLL